MPVLDAATARNLTDAARAHDVVPEIMAAVYAEIRKAAAVGEADCTFILNNWRIRGLNWRRMDLLRIEADLKDLGFQVSFYYVREGERKDVLVTDSDADRLEVRW